MQRKWLGIALATFLFAHVTAKETLAQPARQAPAVRVFLKQQGGDPNGNQRRSPGPGQIGWVSWDIYGKKGYPRFLGDNVDAVSGATGNTGATGQMGQAGQTGLMGLGGGGFQGNLGNQIGQNSGGTILGGLFGGGIGGGIGGGGAIGQLGGLSPGFTGGGFSGMVPKGFGFGGTPDSFRR